MYISIDPGLNFCSVVVIDTTDKFLVIESNIVKNSRKFTEEEKSVEDIYGSRLVKVMCILNKIEEMLKKYTIDTIVIEAPFYNALTPMAYGSLLEVIFAIKYTIIHKHSLKFTLIEPLLVKKLFTNKGMASKEAMKQFLINKLNDNSITMPYKIEDLTEHEIDGIAIGYVYHINQLAQQSLLPKEE